MKLRRQSGEAHNNKNNKKETNKNKRTEKGHSVFEQKIFKCFWLDCFPFPGAESPFPLLVEVSEVYEQTWGGRQKHNNAE